MHTVSVDIKIPDGHEVEEISMIWPEYDFSMDAAVGQMVVKTKAAKPFLINGVPSDWPEWLTCDYVAKDKSGSVFGYHGEPTKGTAMWCASSTWLITGLAAIDIPGDWTQSKRENPRRKK